VRYLDNETVNSAFYFTFNRGIKPHCPQCMPVTWAVIIWTLFIRLLPRDARSTKRGIAIVSRPFVYPFVCPSYCNVEVPWAYTCRLESFEIS